MKRTRNWMLGSRTGEGMHASRDGAVRFPEKPKASKRWSLEEFCGVFLVSFCGLSIAPAKQSEKHGLLLFLHRESWASKRVLNS